MKINNMEDAQNKNRDDDTRLLLPFSYESLNDKNKYTMWVNIIKESLNFIYI